MSLFYIEMILTIVKFAVDEIKVQDEIKMHKTQWLTSSDGDLCRALMFGNKQPQPSQSTVKEPTVQIFDQLGCQSRHSFFILKIVKFKQAWKRHYLTNLTVRWQRYGAESWKQSSISLKPFHLSKRSYQQSEATIHPQQFFTEKSSTWCMAISIHHDAAFILVLMVNQIATMIWNFTWWCMVGCSTAWEVTFFWDWS